MPAATAAQVVRATNTLASQGIVAASTRLAEITAAVESLGALVVTLSEAIAADTPVASPVQAALTAVEAKMVVVAAIVPTITTLAP